jgi:hypothetical protein
MSMKTAVTADGTIVVAQASAPHKAFCPCCGETLTLRRRRSMDKQQETYFWRHRSNGRRDCSRRIRPIG